MKPRKVFLLTTLPFLSTSLLIACASQQQNQSQTPPTVSSEDEVEDVFDPSQRFEIGDIVKEWRSKKSFNGVPFGGPLDAKEGTIEGSIDTSYGYDDRCSLSFEAHPDANNKVYVSSENAPRKFFTDSDVSNGDIVTFSIYFPSNHNIETVQLELSLVNSDTSILSSLYTVQSNDVDNWAMISAIFDSNNALNDIRINITTADAGPAFFSLDNITIEFGEETEASKSDYVYDGESLYQVYEDYIKVGTCMSGNMYNNQICRKVIKDNFNSITAENEGKPERILDQAACQELAATDETAVAITTAPFEKIYDWAEINHIKVRHHTFVWYSQTPEWFFNEKYQSNGKKVTREIMLERMEHFIQVTLETINERWPGLVYAIDVANEAVDNHTVRNNNNNWYTVVGADFVYYAFLYASIYKDEEQELYYNDYSFDYDTENCRYALNTLLKDAIAEGLIDGVGIQGHIDSNANLDNVMNDAKMIYEKGLKCQITELDITTNGTDENSLNKQKDTYKNLIKRALQSNAAGETEINAIIVWGVTDDQSWKRGQNPLLFTSAYKKKPAYYGFLEAVQEI